MISQAAISLIVDAEVSGRAYYEAHYRHPTWPEGASGITVGIGYDLGYSTPDQIAADWSELPDLMIGAMKDVAGLHGQLAEAHLKTVRSRIDISWDIAMRVFINRDIPKWTKLVCNALPNTDKLSPDCLGALVSLAYNRGCSFNATDDRHREMHAIKDHMASQNFSRIPQEFRSMARLWPTMKGLRLRREAEAELFEAGLKSPT